MEHKIALPIVAITDTAKARLLAYVDNCQDEISGFGIVERKDDMLLITDVMIFEQEVSAASSDLDSGHVADFVTKLITDGGDPSKLKLWWHSHASMGVFFSGTDTGTIDGLFGSEYIISLVMNHKHEYKMRMDVYSPFRMTFENLDLVTVSSPNPALIEEVKAEIEQKVKKYTYSGASGKSRGYAGYDPYGFYDDEDGFVYGGYGMLGARATQDAHRGNNTKGKSAAHAQMSGKACLHCGTSLFRYEKYFCSKSCAREFIHAMGYPQDTKVEDIVDALDSYAHFAEESQDLEKKGKGGKP